MDETVQQPGAGGIKSLFRGPRAASLLADAAQWAGIVTPLAVIAGPSFADIAASCLAILFLLHCAATGRWAWIRQPWVMAGLALWAYSVVRTAFADDPARGLAAALPFIRFVVFAAALQALVLPDPRTRRWLVYSACLALSILAFDGLLQYVTGYDIIGRPRWGFRLVAFYHHAWVGAVIAWLFLPVVLTLVDLGRPRLALGFGALWLAIVLLSGDRMALLCALAQLVLLGLFVRRARRTMLIGFPILVLGAAAILSQGPVIYQRQVVSTIETIQNFGHSHYAVIWKSAWALARAHPIFGVGTKGFFQKCLDPSLGPLFPFEPNQMRCAAHPHNTYLEWLDDGGLIGLGLFILTMAYLVTALLPLVRRPDVGWAGPGLFVTLLARLWPLASWTSFHHAWSAVPFWLVVGWGLALAQKERA
jgi:O-antigen ligase